MSTQERFDNIFLNVAQQMDGGVPQFLDAVFGFFGRKTDFFTGGESGQAQDLVLKVFKKHEALSQQREASKPRVVEVKEEPKPKEVQKEKPIEKRVEPVKSDTEKTGEEDEEKGLLPNVGNGSQTDQYTWVQTLSEVEVHIAIPKGVRASQIKVDTKSKHLKVVVKGDPQIIIEGELHAKVKTDECTWVVDPTSGELHISIMKYNGMEWWSRLLVGEPELNTRKIQPENSKMDDLDHDTRAMVQKMQFDSMQKSMGKPTSEDLQKQEMLKKLQAAHPEMDLSNAKFS